MKYRSLYLLLPVLFIASHARAADSQVTVPSNFFNDDPPPSLSQELRDEVIHYCNQPVKAPGDPHSAYRPATVKKPATSKQRIAPLALREKIKRQVPKVEAINLVEEKSDFDGMTMPALTTLVSRWEDWENSSESEKEEASEIPHQTTFVVFGSEKSTDVLMQERPIIAYHFNEIHHLDGCRFEPISAEAFMPGETDSQPAKEHCKIIAPLKMKDTCKEDIKKPKNCTELYDDLQKNNEELIAAMSASDMNPKCLKDRKVIIEQLSPEVQKLIVALQLQYRNLAHAQDNLKNITRVLDAQRTPDDFTFYMQTLVQWYRDYQMTDEERKQEISNEQIARKIFTPEELLLIQETITVKDQFKKSKIVQASKRGQDHEYKLELSSIPRRTVRLPDATGEVVDQTDEEGQPILYEQKGAIPLDRYVDTAQKTYGSWYSSWGQPQDACDLQQTAKSLAQAKQKFNSEKNPSRRADIAKERQELKKKQAELLDGIKEKMLSYMKENLTEYRSDLTEQKNRLESLVESEKWSMEINSRYAASILRHLVDIKGLSTKEAIKTLFTINDSMASDLASRADEMTILVNTAEGYTIQKQEEETVKEDTEIKETTKTPVKKATYANKAAKPKRQTRAKRK